MAFLAWKAKATSRVLDNRREPNLSVSLLTYLAVVIGAAGFVDDSFESLKTLLIFKL